jgi:hypothetical protein
MFAVVSVNYSNLFSIFSPPCKDIHRLALSNILNRSYILVPSAENVVHKREDDHRAVAQRSPIHGVKGRIRSSREEAEYP